MKRLVKRVALVLAVVALGLVALVAYRGHLWRADTSSLVARLGDEGVVRPTGARTHARFTAAHLVELPPPVARYLSTALREGQPLVRRARLEQAGEFLVRPKDNGWVPFTAVQEVRTDPPGFVWAARMSMGPGMRVLVRDALVDGRGSMQASLLGLFRLADAAGTPEIAQGALLRYLAEACWFPTALLPAAGVVWTAIDDTSARATLTAGTTTVSLDFRFGADGLVESVFSPGRAREVEGRFVPTPWQGRWSDHGERDGMKIPLSGEVEWQLPEGAQPYWRGRITGIAYTW